MGADFGVVGGSVRKDGQWVLAGQVEVDLKDVEAGRIRAWSGDVRFFLDEDWAHMHGHGCGLGGVGLLGGRKSRKQGEKYGHQE